MNVSFKQFTSFLSASEGEQSQEKLDEIWKSIFQKKKEEEEADGDDKKKSNVKSKVMTAKERLEKKKEDEKKRKQELEKRRDDAWAKAKERAEGGNAKVRSGQAQDRSEYSWHFQKMKESMPLTERTERQTFSNFDNWLKAAKKLKLDKADVEYVKDIDPNRDSNLASPDGIIVAKWNPKRKEGWTKKADLQEKKTAYSDEGYWKDDAKAAGYKVKKLSGNLMDGDQTWGAFKGDEKMGEFSEAEDKRGGWLMEGKDDDHAEWQQGYDFAKFLRKKNKQATPEEMKDWSKNYLAGYRKGFNE